jgi:quercetin dioxygenase-like cupin family protein
MTATSTAQPFIRTADEGQQRWFFGGGVHTWKATAEETNGAFLLFEDRMTQGKRTPLHAHPDADETMYVLDGEILVDLAGRQERVGAGGLMVAPRGEPHAFLVLSPTARLLCLHTPGTSQAFYWGASEPVGADDGSDRLTGEVDFARVQQSARENGGIVILGPPPFPADDVS